MNATIEKSYHGWTISVQCRPVPKDDATERTAYAARAFAVFQDEHARASWNNTRPQSALIAEWPFRSAALGAQAILEQMELAIDSVKRIQKVAK